MTRMAPERVAQFLRQQGDELTRIWRLARAGARPEVFPGLLDGVVAAGGFFDACGRLLESGAAPERLWDELAGLVRWPPALAPGELTAEWAVVTEVLGAACESVAAEPAAADWLMRATAACEAGTASLGGSRRGPPGVVTALVYSGTAPRRVRQAPRPPGA